MYKKDRIIKSAFPHYAEPACPTFSTPTKRYPEGKTRLL
jgi:hypothetical protein